jgi:PAS domain-containing protein
MFDQSSRFVGYRGIGMELTDRRQADLEQIRFRAAMGAVQEAVLIIARNGARIIDANLTALNLLGYSLTTLRSQTPQALGLAAQAQLAQQFNGLIEHSIAAQKNLSTPEPTVAPTLACKLHRQDAQSISVNLQWQAKYVADDWIMVAVFTVADTEKSTNKNIDKNVDKAINPDTSVDTTGNADTVA